MKSNFESRFNSLMFSPNDRFGNAPLSPEHRAYLGQIRQELFELKKDIKLVPFCDSELSVTAPRWKMAILTWVGVCITVGALGWLIGPLMTDWSWFTNLLAFNAAVVVLLTWVVMPILTWLAQRWLQSRS